MGSSWVGEGEEIRINDMSIIQAPSANEYNFQYIPNENASSEPEVTAVSVVQSETETGTLVNVKGKIKKGQNVKVVGKNNLKMLKCAICNLSGVLQITVWEDEIEQIRDGVVYKITNVGVRNRDHIKSVTITRNSAFIKVNDVQLNEIDENVASQSLDQRPEDTIFTSKKDKVS